MVVHATWAGQLAVTRAWRAVPLSQRRLAVRLARRGVRHPDEGVAVAAHAYAAAVRAHGAGRKLLTVLLVVSVPLLAEAALLRDRLGAALGVGGLLLAWFFYAQRRDARTVLAASRQESEDGRR